MNGKLILYRTQAQGHFNYGIMHVTNVNNSGGGSIKFNYKTFRKFEGDVLQKNDETVHGGASFNLDSEVSGASGNDFQLGNAASQFEILDYAKFYILPN